MKFPTRFKYTPGRIANYFANFVIMKKSFASVRQLRTGSLRRLRPKDGIRRTDLFYERLRYSDPDRKTDRQYGTRAVFPD